MIIAGVDPSLTSTGIAVYRGPDDVAQYLVKSKGKASDTDHDHLPRVVDIRNRVMSHLVDPVHGGIDLVVMEGRANSKFDQGVLHWLWGELFKTVVMGARIPVAVCPPKTMKKFVTDNGNAAKLDVALRIGKLWPDLEFEVDDAADALGLMSVGCVKYREPVPFNVLERHRLAIAKMEWPT